MPPSLLINLTRLQNDINLDNMAAYSSLITDYWSGVFDGGAVINDGDTLTINLNPALDDDSQIMLIEMPDGHIHIVLTPERADQIGLSSRSDIPSAPIFLETFRAALKKEGVTLNSPDYLFYPASSQPINIPLVSHLECRALDAADGQAFALFQSDIPEEDLDGAYVELDHWQVFGLFDKDRLVSAASMYPWDNSKLADLGVVTTPSARGKGYGRIVVTAISNHVSALGYVPQYRCQTDNIASVKLAEAAGFAVFGKWESILPDE